MLGFNLYCLYNSVSAAFRGALGHRVRVPLSEIHCPRGGTAATGNHHAARKVNVLYVWMIVVSIALYYGKDRL